MNAQLSKAFKTVLLFHLPADFRHWKKIITGRSHSLRRLRTLALVSATQNVLGRTAIDSFDSQLGHSRGAPEGVGQGETSLLDTALRQIKIVQQVFALTVLDKDVRQAQSLDVPRIPAAIVGQFEHR